jgi:hypothetical protein
MMSRDKVRQLAFIVAVMTFCGAISFCIFEPSFYRSAIAEANNSPPPTIQSWSNDCDLWLAHDFSSNIELVIDCSDHFAFSGASLTINQSKQSNEYDLRKLIHHYASQKIPPSDLTRRDEIARLIVSFEALRNVTYEIPGDQRSPNTIYFTNTRSGALSVSFANSFLKDFAAYDRIAGAINFRHYLESYLISLCGCGLLLIVMFSGSSKWLDRFAKPLFIFFLVFPLIRFLVAWFVTSASTPGPFRNVLGTGEGIIAHVMLNFLAVALLAMLIAFIGQWIAKLIDFAKRRINVR